MEFGSRKHHRKAVLAVGRLIQREREKEKPNVSRMNK